MCKDATYSVTIIEKLEGTGRNDRDKMDVKAKPERKAREVFWMHELRTVFHMGLMTELVMNINLKIPI